MSSPGSYDYPATTQPPQPGEESAGPALTPLVTELRRTADAMHALYARTSRLWQNYRETASIFGATPQILLVPGIQLGWEGEVERVTVSVGGASSAGTIAVFRIGATAVAPQTAPPESFLVDYTNALLGSSPSRQVAEYTPPIRLGSGEQLLFLLSAYAAGSQQIYIRAEGRKREL